MIEHIILNKKTKKKTKQKTKKVSSNTLLSSSAGAFTLLFSVFFLGEAFSWVKLSWVLLSMTVPFCFVFFSL